MWADDNTKPLQGNMFRVFRSMLMGIVVEYDDDIERKNTHHLLLPKAEAKGMISKQYSEVLQQATGTTGEREHTLGVKNKSILHLNKAVVKQRIVLDDRKYGSGNRPYWALSRTRFPNLIRAFDTEPHTGVRKRISLLYHGLVQ